MNKFSVIDIGTNSVLLLVATRREGVLAPLLERAKITRLGAGYRTGKSLEPESVRRTLETVEEFTRLARDAGTEPFIFGTEILRIAPNAGEFLTEVKEKTGVDVQILTGREEAEMTCLGAVDSMKEPAGKVAVIDIGGGSTEIALSDSLKTLFVHSFPVGAVKLKEKFDLGDPPRPPELRKMKAYIEVFWKSLPDFPAECALAGVGGTLTTLAMVNGRKREYNFHDLDGLILSRNRIEELLDKFIDCSLRQRAALPGMEAGRADIIIPATLILLSFMNWLGREKIVVSARGVRFGYLEKLSTARKTGQKSETIS